jgi:hypothetical protein
LQTGWRSAPNEEILFLLPDRTVSEAAPEFDPTVDLMSRRHPLSSMELQEICPALEELKLT